MPFVQQGNQTGNIELDFLGCRSATQCNRIFGPSVLIEHLSQRLYKQNKIRRIIRANDIPSIPIVDAITGQVFPIDTDAVKHWPLLE